MHITRRLLPIFVFAALLALPAAGAGARTAFTQESDNTDTYSLPASWQGDATVNLNGIADAAPPLEAITAVGGFRIRYLPGDAGDVIRILPDAKTPGESLLLAWSITADSNEPALTPGSVFVLGASARAFSRPDGVMLTIREFDGERWSSSSVPMQDVEWTDYSVTRQVGENAVEAQVGIEWTLPDANAWLEFSNMELAVLPAEEAPQFEFSAVDTPTPVRTLTPPAPTSSVANGTVTDTVAAEAASSRALIVVTSTPTPPNLFAAATQVAEATAKALTTGTPTATPPNVVTATPTPTAISVTNTPSPANDATATYYADYATAMAATTGTPTPLPPDARVVVVLPTPTQTPKARALPAQRAQPAPTATRTPTAIYVEYDRLVFLTPTPTPEFPKEVVGKILFLSDHLARNARTPNAFMINPDGTGLALMTDRALYDRAKARDAFSADKRFRAYSLREPLGSSGAPIQVYYDDAAYASTHHQMTYFGSGTAWAPAWSPRHEEVVIVANDTDNDELWLVKRNQWPPIQLTDNEWEWDRSPSYSPDGRQIIFESNRITGTRQLWIMDANGQNQRQITNLPFETWDPVWVKYTDD